jgi:hypothetical protein
MQHEASAWESPQLRDLRAEFQKNPSLYASVLAALGKLTSEPERVLIRTDRASVDLAIARALALAENGVLARLELCDADC